MRNFLAKYALTSFVLLICSPASADSVDEAAKCAGTFYVLTSVGTIDAGLGQHFEKMSMLSYDMVGAYAEIDRKERFTNRITMELISQYRTQMDRSAANGAAFLPYVQSCMGWANSMGQHLIAAQQTGLSEAEAVSSSPRPSPDYAYPFADWAKMEEIFIAAYREWESMGKVSSDDIYDALP
jgi:hypothetical protein